MSLLRKIFLHDGNGNPITSTLGSLDVTISDTNFIIENRPFKQTTTTVTTLSVDANSGDTSITVASTLGFAVGNVLDIHNGVDEPVYPTIKAIAGNVFTLDKPLDNSYTIGDAVDKIIVNMAVNATLASPQSFIVKPLPGEIYDLTRILIEMTHSSAGDNGLFGNLTPLPNGCVLRYYDGATNKYNSFTIWKTNGDLVTDMYDVNYAARSGGGGSYGTNGRGTFKESGAVVRLNGDNGDFLELLVQDNLSTLTSFRIKAQGHLAII